MPEVIEVPAGKMAAEHRHAFRPNTPKWDHVVVSGEADLLGLSPAAKGAIDNDALLLEYEIHLKVGPWWKDVSVCVPFVTITGYQNKDSDDDDEQAWYITSLKWTTDGEGAPNPGEVRIRLEFVVGVRGSHSWLTRIGYYFTAAGRELGVGGIEKPGPIKKGP